MIGPRPVRWGFLGAGFVASKGLAPAVHAADGAVLQAVAARDAARAAAAEAAKRHAVRAGRRSARNDTPQGEEPTTSPRTC